MKSVNFLIPNYLFFGPEDEEEACRQWKKRSSGHIEALMRKEIYSGNIKVYQERQ